MASRGIERSRAEKQALKQHTKKAERQRIQGEGHRRDFVNEIEFNHAAAGGHADDPIPTRPNSRSALADQRRGAEKGTGVMSISKKIDAAIKVAGARPSRHHRADAVAPLPAGPETVLRRAKSNAEIADSVPTTARRRPTPPAAKSRRRRSDRASHHGQAHRRRPATRAGAGQCRRGAERRADLRHSGIEEERRALDRLQRRREAAEASGPCRQGSRRCPFEGRRRWSRGLGPAVAAQSDALPSIAPASARSSPASLRAAAASSRSDGSRDPPDRTSSRMPSGPRCETVHAPRPPLPGSRWSALKAGKPRPWPGESRRG